MNTHRSPSPIHSNNNNNSIFNNNNYTNNINHHMTNYNIQHSNDVVNNNNQHQHTQHLLNNNSTDNKSVFSHNNNNNDNDSHSDKSTDSIVTSNNNNKSLSQLTTNRVYKFLHHIYSYAYSTSNILSYLYRNPYRRYTVEHDYHLAHIQPATDNTVQTQQLQNYALRILAYANHFYVLPSIGYMISNGLILFVDDDIDGTYSSYDNSILLYSGIITFISAIIFLIDAFLYYYVIIIQRDNSKHNIGVSQASQSIKKHITTYISNTLTAEWLAEVLNIIACILYCISGLLGLPAAVTHITNIFVALDIDRLANICDNTAMGIFVVDAFIYLYIWSTYQDSRYKWYINALYDYDFYAQLFNLFGSLAYMIAVLYGAYVLYDPVGNSSNDDTIWQQKLQLDEQRQQSMQLAGDMLYVIGSVAQELAYYTELRRAKSNGLVSSNSNNNIVDNSIVDSNDDAIQSTKV